VRIVENEHAAEGAPIKKKKRGYAFIVFADDQGMKGSFLDNLDCFTGHVG
jgi:hypothetical protein